MCCSNEPIHYWMDGASQSVIGGSDMCLGTGEC
jgi:hypothetical protein